MSEQLGAPPPGEDEMDRRLRELTEEISSAGRIREPSAAERAKAAKKRPVRRRRGGRVAGWSVAVVVLAVAGFFGWHQVTRPGVGGPNDTQVVTSCGTTDGYSHPDYPGGPASKVQPSGAPINPYSMNAQSGTGVCQNTTGT